MLNLLSFVGYALNTVKVSVRRFFAACEINLYLRPGPLFSTPV